MASCKTDDNKYLIYMMSISLQKAAQDNEKHKDNEFSDIFNVTDQILAYSMSVI